MSHDFSNWSTSDNPNPDELGFAWRMCRADHRKITKLCIISHEHIGVYTHHWRGRTGPHLLRGCEACESGQLPRWYGFLLARIHGIKQDVVMEFTARAAASVIKAEQDFHSLRGRIILLSRPGGKNNSPVSIQFVDTIPASVSLTEPEPIHPLLARIWGFHSGRNVSDRTVALNEAPEYLTARSAEKIKKRRASEAVLDELGELRGLVDQVGKNPMEVNGNHFQS